MTTPASSGYVQVPTDSVGKKIDTTEIVSNNPSATATTPYYTIERQRVDVPDPVIVSGGMLREVLIELRLISILLAAGLNIRDDIDLMRNDLFLQNSANSGDI